MAPRTKRKTSDASPSFSDALSREKLLTKGATPVQTRGNKVAPGIDSDANTSPKEAGASATDKNSKKSNTTKQKKDPPKRTNSAGVKQQSDAPATSPPKRSSSAGKKLQGNSTAEGAPEQNTKEGEAKSPKEDAKGQYDILVQKRRCEQMCAGLGLTMSDIRKMKRKYNDNDMYHSTYYASGEITHAEFFFMINEEERPLTLGLFRCAEVPLTQKFLSFDEYLLCVVSFAVLTKPELYQFVFDLYDDDQSGALDEREFAKMSRELQSKQFNFPANVTMAIKLLEGKEGRAAMAPDDGLVDFGEFMKFAKSFPVAFYPIMNMQKNVRDSTLGESRWSRITANKLKVQELVSYMRRHQGAIPQLTLRESVANIFSSEIFHIRKRAGELYVIELAQLHSVGTGEVEGS